MVSQSSGKGYGFITSRGKEVDEKIIHQVVGLWEAIHVLGDFNEDVVVVDEGSEIEFINAHVFQVWHGRAKIEILEVTGDEFCSRRG